MRPATLKVLECPGCRSRYRAFAHVTDGERVIHGYLTCDCKAAVIPVVDGFVLFTEPLLHAGLADAASLAQLSNRLFGSAQSLEALYQQKRARGLIESYAAFQPFNESARAVEPLLARLLADVHEGDLVLDVWCRTGWSAEWLAGHLPAQHVVAMWEGDSSVLGYRGFRHLLGTERRAPNLDVIFANSDRTLPFGSDSFALLYAHDALHRRSLHPFGAECLRVTRQSGALVFPHVHLSNSEPEPFFERGGTIRHGRDYRAWLDAVTDESERKGLVCSEKKLFESNAGEEIVDEPNTEHYNALIALLPAAHAPVDPRPHSERDRFIPSPLFRVDLARATASVNDQSLSGGCADLMLRHPVYRARLPGPPVSLDGSKLLALVLATAGLDASTIVRSVTAEGRAGTETGRFDLNPVALALRDLVACELLRPAPVTGAAHRLQRYHSNQLPSLDDAVWPIWLRRLSNSSTPMLSLRDGTSVSAPEVAEFLLRVPALLRDLQISPGEWICVSPAQQPLLWLAAIAAAMSGVNVEIGERPIARTHGHRLWLHDDDVDVAEAPCPALPLDRAAEDCLLARLARGSQLTHANADRGGEHRQESPDGDRTNDIPSLTNGQISFATDGYRFVCRMDDFCQGCLALQGQVAQQLFVIEPGDPVKNLACLVLALAAAGRVH
jgi:SAM-dependent methyltransferase